jgi:hypothetical protein
MPHAEGHHPECGHRLGKIYFKIFSIHPLADMFSFDIVNPFQKLFP